MKFKPKRSVALASAVLWSILPISWLALTSLKDRRTVVASPPQLFFPPTLANFSVDYHGDSLLRMVANSATIATISALIVVALGIPAGFAFARNRSAVWRRAFLFVVSSRILSPIALSLPYVMIFSLLSLRGAFVAVIACHVAFSLSLAIWLSERFFLRLDSAVELAARIDGASEAAIFGRIVLPQSWPLISVVLVLSMMFSWNEFLLSSILTQGAHRPLTTALPAFVTQGVTQWGRFAVAALASLVPLLATLAALTKAASRIGPAFIVTAKG